MVIFRFYFKSFSCLIWPCLVEKRKYQFSNFENFSTDGLGDRLLLFQTKTSWRMCGKMFKTTRVVSESQENVTFRKAWLLKVSWLICPYTVSWSCLKHPWYLWFILEVHTGYTGSIYWLYTTFELFIIRCYNYTV